MYQFTPKLRPLAWPLLFLFLFFGCEEPEDNRSLVIAKIKDTAELSTVEFTMKKVVIAQKENNGLLVKLKLKEPIDYSKTFMAYTEAKLEAGINMDNLKEENVLIEGSRISVKLPPVEILNFSYPDSSFVVDTIYTQGYAKKNGWLSPMELDKIYQQAELSVRQNVNYLNVRKEAETRTRIFMENMLKLMGYQEIYISFEQKNPLIWAGPPRDLLNPTDNQSNSNNN